MPYYGRGLSASTRQAQIQLSQHSKMPQYLDNVTAEVLPNVHAHLWLWAVYPNWVSLSTAESAFSNASATMDTMQ